MDNWEFLLQKKGDKSWLPLESSTVEILEGQYRLAARSELANTMIGIAIAYQPSPDSAYHPNQQKISKRISPDGLLIVMPYTHFAPGLWQVNCQMLSPAANQKKISAGIKFDVQSFSADSASEWQLPDLSALESSSEDVSGASEWDAFRRTETNDNDSENFPGLSEITPSASPASSHSSLGSSSTSYVSPMMEMAEQMSEQLVQSLLDEFSPFDEEFNADLEYLNNLDEELLENLPEQFLAQPEPPIAESISAHPETESSEAVLEPAPASIEPPLDLVPEILLNIDRAQYLVSSESSITIAGEAFTAGELEITLKNPENLEILVNVCHFVPQAATDSLSSNVFPFQYAIDIPAQTHAQVLIGEIKLHPTDESLQSHEAYQLSRAITVTYQSPSIVADVAMEMEAIANFMVESAEAVAPSKVKPVSKSPAKTSSAALELPPFTAMPVATVPTPKPAIATPPQSQSNAAIKSPSLPNLPGPSPAVREASDLTPRQSYDEFTELFESELTDSEVEAENIYPLTPEADTSEEPDLRYLFEEGLPSDYERMLEEPPGNAKPSLLESLNIGDRFLSKLQSLSADAIAEKTEAAATAETTEPEATSAEVLEPSPSTPTSIPESRVSPTRSEVDPVAELNLELERLLSPDTSSQQAERLWEDPSERSNEGTAVPEELSQASVPSRNLNYDRATNLTQPMGTSSSQTPHIPTLTSQEPVPLPIIELPTGDLVAGVSIPTRIKLPAIAPQLYVKFWIKDCQTRATIDGPRWLVDFKPETEPEFVETIMQISIPLGSMEVALEAVTIEVQTQRESHKARITRSISPPNLSQDSDLDFEIPL
jgi:hypothetical protein